MIFISHTYADKPLIETIALKLAEVFGQDAVFYDSWSIQPGDGIISKMNEALAKCKFFFFFVSKRSLTSKMVELEWQNAIIKATKGEAKLIPVRLDDCTMPPLLLQTLYIDLYTNGPEVALRQMVDVIQGKSTFRQNDEGFQNIRGYVTRIDGGVKIQFCAEVYMEPHSRYAILVENDENEITWKAENESMTIGGFNKDVLLNDGRKVNVIAIGRYSATTPNFPFTVEVTASGAAQVKLIGLMRATSNEEYKGVPMLIL